jgi:lipopolysaccharide export system permease protein
LSKILDRYIFSELLTPFLISVAALCCVMLSKELLRLVELLVAKGVGVLAVLRVFLHLMPSFLVLTLPIAGIIASISAFSRLSYDKELVAMRAAGLSLVRLSRPVFVFSCLIFVLTLVLSQYGQPWSSVSLKKLALNLLRDQLALALDRGVFNEPIPRVTVYVSDTANPPGIFIADERNPQEARIVVAGAYSVFHDATRNIIGLHLLNGTIHTRAATLDQYQQANFRAYDFPIPLDQTLYAAVDERPSRETLLAQLDKTGWRDAGARKRLMEDYKDLAFPTASFIFGMLGVPVGIVSKRSGRIGGFAVGVMIVVVYYILNVLCEFFVTTLWISPFAGAWLPNGLFLGLTVFLFQRVGRQ